MFHLRKFIWSPEHTKHWVKCTIVKANSIHQDKTALKGDLIRMLKIWLFFMSANSIILILKSKQEVLTYNSLQHPPKQIQEYEHGNRSIKKKCLNCIYQLTLSFVTTSLIAVITTSESSATSAVERNKGQRISNDNLRTSRVTYSTHHTLNELTQKVKPRTLSTNPKFILTITVCGNTYTCHVLAV